MKLEHTYYSLSNGLRVVLHRQTANPIVCVNLAYHVGSKDERKGRRGFAHLFEHLMYEGSGNIPRGWFDWYCENAGGYNNAYTNEDKTNYHIVLPANQLELGLWLESDRLLRLNITNDSLETQRKVVMEERRQRVDNQPYGSFDTKIAELLYGDHPYGHPVIGYMEDIAAATMEEVVAFYSTYYRPNNAVLVVAGDIEIEETKYLVEKYFGVISEGGNIPRYESSGAFAAKEIRETFEENVPLPAVFIGYRIPPEADPEFIPSDLISDILGNGESSLLHTSLIYERQIANQVSVFVEPRQYSGQLMICAFANPGRSAQELLEAIDKEIEKLQCNGVSEKELEKNLNRVEALYYHNLESLSSRAERFAHFALFYDQPDMIHSVLDKYFSTEPEAIRDSSLKYLHRNNRVVLHYVPNEKHE